MASTEETYPVVCRGGLDLTSSTQDLLQKPGYATRLLNFEPSTEGGYRRISGQTLLGRTPDSTQSRIKGLTWIDNKLLIACQGDHVYITYDLVNWVQINKVMDLEVANVGGMDYIDLQAAPSLPRASSFHYDFQIFRQGTEVIIMGACEGHSPFYFKLIGTTLSNTTYSYKELSLTSGSLDGALHAEKYKDQYVISGMDTAPAEIFYSDILKPDDFEGANAGAIGFNDTVMGLKMFRDILYVFCRNSIHKVKGLSSGSPQRETVTTKIGCVNGDTIQELAGDLVFLSPDGLRTLSATQNIDDVNLSTLSDGVATKLRSINSSIESYNVRTETLKSKVQYRIFFTPKAGSGVGPYSAIMRMSLGERGLTPEFSEISGFDVAAIYNGFYSGTERTITGDSLGNIWYHDSGKDMGGVEINFLYETPFFSINDPGVRKNIHKLVSYLKIEGATTFRLALRFDFNNPEAYQPVPYTIGPYLAPGIYGIGSYSNAKYGAANAQQSPVVNTLTEGSGKTLSLRIFPSGEPCAPFSLQGFDVHFVPAGRI
jgi:hypothetical protein